jgi:hypothetical protein
MFNRGFYERLAGEAKRLSLTHQMSHIFNTRANRVVVACSVITKICNPMQVLDGHI